MPNTYRTESIHVTYPGYPAADVLEPDNSESTFLQPARSTEMPIKKQEFYEGAALHLLARSGKIQSVQYESPFFVLNNQFLVHLKYSTRSRSPWGFTFTPEEQSLLEKRAAEFEIVIGLICGSDGVAAFSYDALRSVAAPRRSAVHVACYRQHGEHYEVNGPDGTLKRKVPPSYWQRILDRRGDDEA